MGLRQAAQQARNALANARDYIYLLETGEVSWSEEDQLEEIRAAITALRAALAEPERKPLTDVELRGCFNRTNTAEPLAEGWPGLERFARAIEAHHGIKEQP